MEGRLRQIRQMSIEIMPLPHQLLSMKELYLNGCYASF